MEESDTREELIKNYFSKRNAEVTWKLQAADSKALHLHSEVSRSFILGENLSGFAK